MKRRVKRKRLTTMQSIRLHNSDLMKSNAILIDKVRGFEERQLKHRELEACLVQFRQLVACIVEDLEQSSNEERFGKDVVLALLMSQQLISKYSVAIQHKSLDD